jgi:hypothetical protein
MHTGKDEPTIKRIEEKGKETETEVERRIEGEIE